MEANPKSPDYLRPATTSSLVVGIDLLIINQPKVNGNIKVLLKDAKGERRGSLKASNGRVLTDSGEGYSNLSDCLEAIDLVKESKDAPVKKEEKA